MPCINSQRGCFCIEKMHIVSPVRLLFACHLLPRIIESPDDNLTLCHCAQLLGFALELVVKELQTRRLLDLLDGHDKAS
jgi:hypothetical protein